MRLKATIIELDHQKALVMTEHCEFIHIRRRDGMKLGLEVEYTHREKIHEVQRLKKIVSVMGSIAAVAIFALVLGLMVNRFNPTATPTAYIDLDINPSIRLAIDKQHRVLSAEAINSDAETYLSRVVLTGKSVNNAILMLSRQYAAQMASNNHLIVFSTAVSTLELYPEDIKKQEMKLYQSLSRLTTDSRLLEIGFDAVIHSANEDTLASARSHGLSMAREMAYTLAASKGLEVSEESISLMSASEIEAVLSGKQVEKEPVPDLSTPVPTPTETEATPSPQPEPSGEPQEPIATSTPAPTQKPTPAPTPKPTIAPTQKPTPAPTPKPTIAPTQKPTPAPTPKPTTAPTVITKANVSAKTTTDGVSISWNMVSSVGFQYYKIVLSSTNPTPKYPSYGYLTALSDVNYTGYWLAAGSNYQGGDFGGQLKAGERYYLSITTVYEIGGKTQYFSGNVVQITIPGKAVPTATPKPVATPTPTIKPTATPAPVDSNLNVQAFQTDNGVKMIWTPLSGNGFQYYKIVISQYNSRPAYPADGYYDYFTDQNKSSFPITDAYGQASGGDFGGQLVSGESYWFSVTAVFNDKKVIGNAVKVTWP